MALSGCCVCCKKLLLGLVLIAIVSCYFGCSFHCVLTALSRLPVIGKCLSGVAELQPPSSETASGNDGARTFHPVWFDDPADVPLFTAEQLEEYRGDKGLYLGALGRIYDVTKAAVHYGKGKEYHGFIGRDASRAFAKNGFTAEDLTDDVSDFKRKQWITLGAWASNYDRDFSLVGKLVGRYYNDQGLATQELAWVWDEIEKAYSNEKLEEDLLVIFPGCSSRFILGEGGKFWCNANGRREYDGFPRRLTIKESGKIRCACVREELLDDPRLEEYPGCPKDATECHLDHVSHDEL